MDAQGDSTPPVGSTPSVTSTITYGTNGIQAYLTPNGIDIEPISANSDQLSSTAQSVIAQVNQANPGGFINTVGLVMAAAYTGLAGLAEGAGLLLGVGPVVIAGAESPQGQEVIVNIGGALEGPSNAIILQTGQIGGSTEAALQNASEIAGATGQQVVVGAGNSIPFATGSVNQVIMNNVPVGIGSGYFGPYVDPSEVLRILAPGGTVTGSSAGSFFNLVSAGHP
jgi:hypothetical protein